MTDTFKVCPICQTRNQEHALICLTCGASIAQTAAQGPARAADSAASRYDFRLGDADLAEESLGRRGRLLSALLVLTTVALAFAFALALLSFRLDRGGAAVLQSATAMPTRMAGPSVTPGPPSATLTASPMPSAPPTETVTPAPCRRLVAAGDSLIRIISGCGHRNLDILPTVMRINGISDEALIRIGQEIIVPLPSATNDPAATEAPASEADVDAAAAGSRSEGLALLAFDPLAPTETPTLLPGLMWHIVQPDENMIAIALQYKTNAKALSDLNPEIEFQLCEFGLDYGGPECTVHLWQGQKIRVPAPTPTRTPIPTASGSETPTPPPTPTYNAPIAQSPANEAFIAPAQRVTLRWVGTGRLAADEVYRVVLLDRDSGSTYTADTRELFFIVPEAWQPQDANSHQYVWQVDVFNSGSGLVSHSSAERSFLWQGAGRESA